MSIAHVSEERKPKVRIPKVRKGQSISARREVDRQRRQRRRARTDRRAHELAHYRFRVRVVRAYRAVRRQLSERAAVKRIFAQFQPRADADFPLSVRTIRHWNTCVSRYGFGCLRTHSRRPLTIHTRIDDRVVGLILTLRDYFGWGGQRIAAELDKRGLATVSHAGVYGVLQRHGRPLKRYALKGRSDGIAYRRYRSSRPNRQWHIDFKQTALADGTKVWICVLIDDYSRYALSAMAGLSATTGWTCQVVRATLAAYGRPGQVVSDNGRVFVSVWENTLTTFTQLLVEHGIEHLRCAPYYPQGNGKVEAFNKTLGRELLERKQFQSVEELQAALDSYLTYYNNYRLHSALNWQPPVTSYTGVGVQIAGLAGLPGLEPMAADPQWGVSACDDPVPITPQSAQNAFALTCWQPSVAPVCA